MSRRDGPRPNPRGRQSDLGPAKPFARGTEVEFTVESIAAGGDAFAKVDGLAVFADRGLPGDTIRAVVEKRKKSFAKARTTGWSSKGAGTIDAACPVASECGGCRFQSASYSDELRWKVEATYSAITRIARDLPWPEYDVIESVTPDSYRHRARLRMDADGQLGFFRGGSNEVVPTENCMVLHPALNDARPISRALFGGLEGLESIFLEWDNVRDGVAITGEFAERDLPHVLRTVRSRIEPMKPLLDVTTIVVRAKWRPTTIVGDGCVWRDHRCGNQTIIVKEPAAGFSQANAETNSRIVDLVQQHIGRVDGRQALELFGGAGNLTFPILGAGYNVDTLDVGEQAVHAAAAAWKVWDKRPPRRARFHASDLEAGLPGDLIPLTKESVTIVADPPRGGMSEALVSDLEYARKGKTFVYVSCDPASMARDVARLAEHGWMPKELSFIDMFPRTPHVEAVVCLRRG
ncbi:MAG: 23S rRNA (uracil1939-C5)-methyltransferase [Bradymonadia bacterium]